MMDWVGGKLKVNLFLMEISVDAKAGLRVN
jgi:hypothetical protein